MKKITKLPAHLVKGGSGARAAEQSLGLFSVTGYTVFHSENTHSSQRPVFVLEFPLSRVQLLRQTWEQELWAPALSFSSPSLVTQLHFNLLPRFLGKICFPQLPLLLRWPMIYKLKFSEIIKNTFTARMCSFSASCFPPRA